MSNHPTEAPPAGEHIHLPGPSVQPALVALGLMAMLLGILEFPAVGVLGGLLMLAAIVSWLRAAVRDYRSLPASHD